MGTYTAWCINIDDQNLRFCRRYVLSDNLEDLQNNIARNPKSCVHCYWPDNHYRQNKIHDKPVGTENITLEICSYVGYEI